MRMHDGYQCIGVFAVHYRVRQTEKERERQIESQRETPVSYRGLQEAYWAPVGARSCTAPLCGGGSGGPLGSVAALVMCMWKWGCFGSSRVSSFNSLAWSLTIQMFASSVLSSQPGLSERCPVFSW